MRVVLWRVAEQLKEVRTNRERGELLGAFTNRNVVERTKEHNSEEEIHHNKRRIEVNR